MSKIRVSICAPSAQDAQYVEAWADDPNQRILGRGWLPYGYNFRDCLELVLRFLVGRTIARMTPNLSLIKEPSKMVMLGDSYSGPHQPPSQLSWICAGQPLCARLFKPADPRLSSGPNPPCAPQAPVGGTYASLAPRHPKYDGVTLAFVDGHAKWFNVKAVVPNKLPGQLPAPCTGDANLIRDANAAGLRWILFNDCF
jgi:prepilin-type processing-associated H-X9-DG protein